MKARYVIIIDAIWTLAFSTAALWIDGFLKFDNLLWVAIVWGCVAIIPWAFVDEEFYETPEQHNERITRNRLQLQNSENKK